MRNFLLDLRYRLEYWGLAPDRRAGARGAARCRRSTSRRKPGGCIAPYDRRHQRASPISPSPSRRRAEAEREAIALAHVGEPRPRDGRDHADRSHHRRSRHGSRSSASTCSAAIAASSGAAIGVTLHMGNWELAVWPLTVAGNNPAAVYRTVNNPYVDRYLRWLRARPLSGRPARQGAQPRGERRTSRGRSWIFVRQGGRLGLVCDLHDRTGLPVPFFGRPAPVRGHPGDDRAP